MQYVCSIRTPAAKESDEEIAILQSQKDTVKKLRRQGHQVANEPPRKTHSVYVLELKPEVAKKSKVKKANPNRNPDLEVLYVGQTSRTPEGRLRQHKRGYRSERLFNPEHVVGLRKDLCSYDSRMPKLDALIAERDLAKDLRSRGYTVLGGH